MTVAELDERMDVDEYAQWQAYDRVRAESRPGRRLPEGALGDDDEPEAPRKRATPQEIAAFMARLN